MVDSSATKIETERVGRVVRFDLGCTPWEGEDIAVERDIIG